jgi:RNA polymerase sigma-70 factor, ECF subfamily
MVDAWFAGGLGSDEFGHFKFTLTRANGQPAAVNYVRRPGAEAYQLFALDVLRIEDGVITDITAFHGPALKPFGLPNTLPV